MAPSSWVGSQFSLLLPMDRLSVPGPLGVGAMLQSPPRFSRMASSNGTCFQRKQGCKFEPGVHVSGPMVAWLAGYWPVLATASAEPTHSLRAAWEEGRFLSHP